MIHAFRIILPGMVLVFALACSGSDDPPKMLSVGTDSNSKQIPAEIRESFVTIPPVYKFPLGASSSTISSNVTNYRVRTVTLDEYAIMNCEVTTQMYVDFLNAPQSASSGSSSGTTGGAASISLSGGREGFYDAAMMNDYLCGIYRTDSKGGLVDVQGSGSATVSSNAIAGDNFLFKPGAVDPFQEGVGRLKGRQQASTSSADGGYRYHVSTGRARYPVTFISQADAIGFTRWLGVQYRLPTEDEWELAAKSRNPAVEFPADTAGSTMASSDTVANFQAGFHSLANFQGEYASPLWPTRVKSYAPNAMGLYDMAGNVWEWTTSTAFASTSSSGESYLKGGSWNSRYLQEMAAWNRLGPAPTASRVSDLGFRIVFSTKAYPTVGNLAITSSGNGTP